MKLFPHNSVDSAPRSLFTKLLTQTLGSFLIPTVLLISSSRAEPVASPSRPSSPKFKQAAKQVIKLNRTKGSNGDALKKQLSVGSGNKNPLTQSTNQNKNQNTVAAHIPLPPPAPPLPKTPNNASQNSGHSKNSVNASGPSQSNTQAHAQNLSQAQSAAPSTSASNPASALASNPASALASNPASALASNPAPNLPRAKAGPGKFLKSDLRPNSAQNAEATTSSQHQNPPIASAAENANQQYGTRRHSEPELAQNVDSENESSNKPKRRNSSSTAYDIARHPLAARDRWPLTNFGMGMMAPFGGGMYGGSMYGGGYGGSYGGSYGGNYGGAYGGNYGGGYGGNYGSGYGARPGMTGGGGYY